MIANNFTSILELPTQIIRIRSNKLFFKPVEILAPEGDTPGVLSQRDLIPIISINIHLTFWGCWPCLWAFSAIGRAVQPRKYDWMDNTPRIFRVRLGSIGIKIVLIISGRSSIWNISPGRWSLGCCLWNHRGWGCWVGSGSFLWILGLSIIIFSYFWILYRMGYYYRTGIRKGFRILIC